MGGGFFAQALRVQAINLEMLSVLWSLLRAEGLVTTRFFLNWWSDFRQNWKVEVVPSTRHRIRAFEEDETMIEVA